MKHTDAIDQGALEGARLNQDLNALAKIDPDVAQSLVDLGMPDARTAPRDIATLVRIVIGQQVSTKAAATVFARLENACDGEITSNKLQRLGETGLREQGLSGRKTSYLLDLAQAVQDQTAQINQWPKMTDHDVIQAITNLRGFGPWSAEIYLIFALGRSDIMPCDDLAMRLGYAKLKRLPEPPTSKELRGLTKVWQPFRSAGALVLWQVYGAVTLEG